MLHITETAQAVLEKRYFIEGEKTWADLCNRVANFFCKDEKEFEDFYTVMVDGDFLPNSPALMNAGTDITSYSACYVLPIHDNIDSIYKFYSDAAKISKSGGGIGANYSELRAVNSTVASTGGVASGPLSFMEVQNTSTEVIKQGGRRRGANMGILDCNHPDLLQFIRVKDEAGRLENFNLSVRLDDKFMAYPLGAGGDVAEQLWDELCQRAWSSAEPGVLFGDTIEKGNTVPHLGKLVAVNPCGEQPLLPYENCCLGSVNLAHMVDDNGNLDRDKLMLTVAIGTLLLNRILDASILPIPECQDAMELTRKIGIGIMGLHDMLIQMGYAYDSEKGREAASYAQSIVSHTADITSVILGKEEGLYKGYLPGKSPERRNANITTIAPTGTLSMIADCSSGCEPYYAPITYKTVLDGTTFKMPNKWAKRFMDEEGVDELDKLSVERKNLLKGAAEIPPKDHVLMQATLQKHIDSSISKTINMPSSATVEDVKEMYELAYKTGCKGVTVYRDGCRAEQVLSTTDRVAVGGSSKLDGIIRQHTDSRQACTKGELPDTLEATRYRVRVGGQKVYIIICWDKEGPKEVFAKFPYRRDGNWNTLCRSISLSLRYGIPLTEVIKQLEKSVEVINDMPSQLAKILKTYLSSTGVNVGSPCPECGVELIFQEGCEKCYACGYSKCG